MAQSNTEDTKSPNSLSAMLHAAETVLFLCMLPLQVWCRPVWCGMCSVPCVLQACFAPSAALLHSH